MLDVRLSKMNRKGSSIEMISNFLLWIVFFILAGTAVFFLIKKFTT